MNNNIEDIVDQVRSGKDGRDRVIRMLYANEKLKTLAIHYIIKNSGSKEDAEDIFSEGVIAFVVQCYRKDFKLSTNVVNYILAIIRNKWISQKTKNIQTSEIEQVDKLGYANVQTPEYLLLDSERKEKFKAMIESLDAKCRDVLSMWSHNVRMRQIAVSMNYKSEGMARKKKFECMQKLALLVKSNQGI